MAPLLSFEPETLDEIIDTLDLVGLVGQRTASVCQALDL